MPLALLSFSLERESSMAISEEHQRVCFEAGWEVIERTVALFSHVQFDDVDELLKKNLDGTKCDKPPFRKFRKFLTERALIPKKVLMKMRGNVNEVFNG